MNLTVQKNLNNLETTTQERVRHYYNRCDNISLEFNLLEEPEARLNLWGNPEDMRINRGFWGSRD